MNNTDRYVIQKGLNSRFYSFSNTPNSSLDNFILNHLELRNKIDQNYIEKVVLKATEEAIKEEIQKAFK